MTRATLAPQYDPSVTEAPTYARWQEAGVFTADRESQKAPYVIVIPPPNVTAVLHMGHGLNNTLQDVLTRFERMRGREALYLPGIDHAGIATQNVVERLLAAEGKTRHDVGREAFVERVWEHVHATGNTILDQLKAIGCSCDWTRTRFTLDEGYSAAVRRVFVTLFQQGLVYRGHRIIHWCPRCLTALSDEEAESHETDGTLYHIRYQLAGQTPESDGAVVATTRPETMFGDVALVFHPDDERYAHLRGQSVEIPLSRQVIPIDTHASVEQEFGTGLLKVTPAHDANDFEIAADLPGTEKPVIMTADGMMDDVARVPADLRGMDRFKARARIVERLRASGQLVKEEPHKHSPRLCYRCGTVVEPRLSDQWFVKMRPLADRALREFRAGRLRLLPERWGPVYENWLEGIRDWCISRQLWWGHRIPAWYCEDQECRHITVAETDPPACEACGGAARQDGDVLDTWFSSALWPFATLGWPERTPDLQRFYPGHTLVTAPDIIFFWVARMVMMGYHYLDERPYETVILNGIVRDTQHRKMSKSAGNGIDPLEVVERFGADAMRFTVSAAAPVGTDVVLDPDDLETSFAPGRNFVNKLWNAGRFILTNLDGAPAGVGGLDPAQFELADRWILSRTQRAVAAATEAMERFRLSDAATDTYHFIWSELADWYIEQVKPRLYGDAPGGDVARGILAYVLETSLRLLHPVVPFVTEELWSHLPGEREPLLARASWPRPVDELIDEEAEDRFARVQALVTAVRAIRSEYGVQPSQLVRATVRPSSVDALESFNAEERTIERLAKVSSLSRNGDTEGVGAHAVLPDGSAVFVPLGDAIDLEKECARLGADLERLDRQLAGVEATLRNPKFIDRAPAEIVERERAKERSWRDQRTTLAEKLRVLGC